MLNAKCKKKQDYKIGRLQTPSIIVLKSEKATKACRNELLPKSILVTHLNLLFLSEWKNRFEVRRLDVEKA